jgi:CSLREA domain-containing protein
MLRRTHALNGFAAMVFALASSATVASAQSFPPIGPPPPLLIPGATYTVTTIQDTNGACDVSCSLREAITAANNHLRVANQLPDQIVFRIDILHALQITPTSPLPPVTGTVTIDGTNLPTQSSILLPNGQRAPIEIQHPGTIELRGGSGASRGLLLNGQVTVRDLEVSHFSTTGIETNALSGSLRTLEGLNVHDNGTGVRANGTNVSLRGSTISANGTGVVLAGNQIVVSGNTITGNSGSGINAQLDNGANTIGGDSASQRNVISGNGDAGIFASVVLEPSPGVLTIKGNFIGTDATGTQAFPNATSGIEIDGFLGSTSDSLSSHALIVSNVISGNNKDGVLAIGGIGHVLESNFIGTDVSGTLSIGNGHQGQFSGVQLQDARGVTVGGNVIAHNANTGVLVDTVQTQTAGGNTIRQNRIFANGRLGIDLASQAEIGFGTVTQNDSGDTDSGANQRQNFPVLQSAIRQADGSISVTGVLDSVAQVQQYNVDLYLSAACNSPAPNGEGEQVLGSVLVTSNGAGHANITFQSGTATALTNGVLTATATRTSTGDTSEFSACVPLV